MAARRECWRTTITSPGHIPPGVAPVLPCCWLVMARAGPNPGAKAGGCPAPARKANSVGLGAKQRESFEGLKTPRRFAMAKSESANERTKGPGYTNVYKCNQKGNSSLHKRKGNICTHLSGPRTAFSLCLANGAEFGSCRGAATKAVATRERRPIRGTRLFAVRRARGRRRRGATATQRRSGSKTPRCSTGSGAVARTGGSESASGRPDSAGLGLEPGGDGGSLGALTRQRTRSGFWPSTP
jgi:hypothetical protein